MAFPYTQRHGGDFVNSPSTSTPIDAVFLNALETALIALMNDVPAANEVPVYDAGTGKFVAQKVTNAMIDAAAAIAYSKLALTGSILNADINAAAAIAYSKLNLAGSIVNADISGAAAISLTKLAGYPSDATKFVRGDGTWGAGTQVSLSVGTSFPGSPTDGDEYIYAADPTNGVYWHFKYRTSTTKWIFVGGAPLFAEVTTAESTTSGTYAAMSTAGPAIALPFAGDYDVEIGAANFVEGSVPCYMSYDIGGTGAVDADAVFVLSNSAQGGSFSRRRRKTGVTAVTLTAKYKSYNGVSAALARNRWMAVWPVQK